MGPALIPTFLLEADNPWMSAALKRKDSGLDRYGPGYGF
jgi:hypothetical protein